MRAIALLVVAACCHALSFTHTQQRLAIVSRPTLGHGIHQDTRTRAVVTMRDASSAYWFSTGDSVRVVDDVVKAGASLKARVGTVVETWEKCDVDPTCCCAEQVDTGMAVRVEFQGTETDGSVSGTSFMHFFAEEELIKVKEDEKTASKEELPFDGMSCKAFKLDHLKMGEQAKRIAAFEQSRTDDS